MKDIVNVPLDVRMIGNTEAFAPNVIDLYNSHDGEIRGRDHTRRGVSVVELAGRTCYGAYSRKNAKTDSHQGYIENMLRQNHLSVIEHAVVTFHISGISRAETHEFVRHRHFSYSQQSQRYVIVEKPYKVALHPTLLDFYNQMALLEMLQQDFEMTETIYNGLRKQGLGRKQASEAARAFLPNAAATEIVVTGNLRSWLEFIAKRDHEAADLGIRRLAKAIGKELEAFYPEVFAPEAREIWDDTYAQGGNNYEA